MARYLSLSLAGLLAACGSTASGPLPPVADNLPSDVREAQAEFDRRTRVAFPVGSSEAEVVAELKRAGFDVDPVARDGLRSAEVRRADWVCHRVWSVRWRSEAARVRDVSGLFGLTCL